MSSCLFATLQKIYEEGGRFFWIHNTGPIGCLPYNVIYYDSKPGTIDENGCVKPQNAVAQEFNRQLKDMVLKLRGEHPLAVFTYVDVYSAKYALISHAKDLGNLISSLISVLTTRMSLCYIKYFLWSLAKKKKKRRYFLWFGDDRIC